MIRDKKRLIFNLVIIFCMFLLVLCFCPLMGDDWPNYGNGIFNIINCLRRTYHYYMWWEGRISSRFLIFIFTCNKYLWNFICALMSVCLIYFGSKFINKKNIRQNVLILSLLILFVDYYLFTQNFLWIAGTVTYTLATFFSLIYIFYLFNKIENHLEFKKFELLILCLFNIFLCTFVENIAVAVVVGNILFSIYLYYTKNVNYKKLMILCFFSLIGLLIQVLSPGTAYRIVYEASDFNKLNIFQKIVVNLPKFVRFGFVNNSVMVLIMSFSAICLINNKVKNNFLKIILIIFYSVIPFITIISTLYLMSPIEFKLLKAIYDNNIFINSNNLLIIFYWLLFIILYFVLIVKYINKNNKFKILFVYLFGLSSIGSMLMAPTWSERVTFLFVFYNYLLSLMVINETSYKNILSNRIVYIIFEFLLVSYVILMIVIYYNVYNCVRYRDNYIISHQNNNEEKVNFYLVPDRLLWNQYPYNNQYKDGFKNSINLKNDLDYEAVYDGWRYGIFFNKDNIKNR